ncbi:hypothetical protein JCM9279_000828 [Rhodotorula babjevae]
MELSSPPAIYSKSDPQTAEANKDYSMTSPLEKDGSNWPAKGRATKDIVDGIEPVATLVAGDDFSWDLAGTATHNGGSCQVGVSYDYMETQVVIASWIGDCPLKKPYTFKVPEKLPGCSKCLFFWSWFNKTGNREMYQNAAVVSISGTSTSFTGPQAFRMNTFGDGVCSLTAEEPVVFPAPGEQVIYGSGFDKSTASNAPDCPDWDNNKEVTVTGSGDGPSDAKPSGGAAAGSADASSSAPAASGSAAAGATGGKSNAGGDAKSTSSGSAGATADAATGAASGSTRSGAAGAAQTAGSTGSSGAGSGSASSSSSGSADSSSSSSDKEFLLFAGGAVALVVIAGVVVFLTHRNLSSSAASTRTRRHSRPRRVSSSDSSDSSYDDRRRRGGRRSRRGRKRSYRDEEKDSSSSDD